MRTPRFLPIAGALGLTLMVALFWYHEHVSIAARDVDSVPASSPASALGEPTLEGGRNVSSRGPATIDAEVGRFDPGVILLESDDRALPGRAALADRADPAFEIARSTLAEAIDRQLPDLALSSNELDDLADATLRLRNAQAALRAIPETREHADQRAGERRRLEEAITDFTYLVEMTPAEFARRVEPGFGIDEWDPADAASGEVLLRPIRPREGFE